MECTPLERGIADEALPWVFPAMVKSSFREERHMSVDDRSGGTGRRWYLRTCSWHRGSTWTPSGGSSHDVAAISANGRIMVGTERTQLEDVEGWLSRTRHPRRLRRQRTRGRERLPEVAT